MKNLQKILMIMAALMIFSHRSFAMTQTITIVRDTIPVDSTDYIFEKVEVEAGFPGGDKAWRNFLEQNLDPSVPVNNGAPAGNYTVVVQFIVDKSGKVTNLLPLTNHGYGMEAEVLRILKKSPQWTPAVQKGRLVKAYRKQPITFAVIVEKRKKKKNREILP